MKTQTGILATSLKSSKHLYWDTVAKEIQNGFNRRMSTNVKRPRRKTSKLKKAAKGRTSRPKGK